MSAGKPPTTIAVMEIEGGPWISHGITARVHAILFNNGRIWDAVNGWRPEAWDKERVKEMRERLNPRAN